MFKRRIFFIGGSCCFHGTSILVAFVVVTFVVCWKSHNALTIIKYVKMIVIYVFVAQLWRRANIMKGAARGEGRLGRDDSCHICGAGIVICKFVSAIHFRARCVHIHTTVRFERFKQQANTCEEHKAPHFQQFNVVQELNLCKLE